MAIAMLQSYPPRDPVSTAAGVSRTWGEWFRTVRDAILAISAIVDRVSIVTGDPSGVLVADVGQLALRTDGGAGSTLYVKESGSGTSAGWAAK